MLGLTNSSSDKQTNALKPLLTIIHFVLPKQEKPVNHEGESRSFSNIVISDDCFRASFRQGLERPKKNHQPQVLLSTKLYP